MKKYCLILTVIALLGMLSLFAGNASADETMLQQQCGSGNVYINEIDYTQPAIDDREFIELKGSSSFALDDYEVHFFDDTNRTAYRTVTLKVQTLSRAGYLVIGNRSISLPSYTNKLSIEQTDFIVNSQPGGVGIWDTTTQSYCAFINYGGTVAGFENWPNIGQDSRTDGIERSCARRDSGWWSCDRQITPGGSNGTVAVQLVTASIAPTASPLFALMVIFAGLSITAQVVWVKH